MQRKHGDIEKPLHLIDVPRDVIEVYRCYQQLLEYAGLSIEYVNTNTIESMPIDYRIRFEDSLVDFLLQTKSISSKFGESHAHFQGKTLEVRLDECYDRLDKARDLVRDCLSAEFGFVKIVGFYTKGFDGDCHFTPLWMCGAICDKREKFYDREIKFIAMEHSAYRMIHPDRARDDGRPRPDRGNRGNLDMAYGGASSGQGDARGTRYSTGVSTLGLGIEYFVEYCMWNMLLIELSYWGPDPSTRFIAEPRNRMVSLLMEEVYPMLALGTARILDENDHSLIQHFNVVKTHLTTGCRCGEAKKNRNYETSFLMNMVASIQTWIPWSYQQIFQIFQQYSRVGHGKTSVTADPEELRRATGKQAKPGEPSSEQVFRPLVTLAVADSLKLVVTEMAANIQQQLLERKVAELHSSK